MVLLPRSLRCSFSLAQRIRFLATITEPGIGAPVQGPARAVKTRIKYEELPKSRVLPDGTLAEPLGEWETGEDLELPHPPKRTRRRTVVTSDTDTAVTGLVKAKRSRKSKVDADQVEPTVTSTETKVKRTRKKKNEVEPAEEDRAVKVISQRRARRAKEVSEEPTVSDTASSEPRTTLAKEILDNLARFPHCLLLTRVGQFYESYFDQAIEIARILNIKLTTRKWGQGRVAMCGFPIMHLDKYLKIMVEQEKKFVAMCEEFPQYQKAGVKTFERRVARVITPGTLIDESFLNQYENNYLLAIGLPDGAMDIRSSQPVGLAWIDVSTGEFYSKASTLESVRDDVARIGPREIVLHASLQQDREHPIFTALNEDANCISFSTLADPAASPVVEEGPEVEDVSTESDPEAPSSGSRETSSPSIPDEITTTEVPAPASYTCEETLSIDLLTSYLKAHLLEHMPTLSHPNRENVSDRMHIDSHTIKALEIRESIREGGVTGSLLSTIKRTTTTSGTRLLTRWLCSPSTSITEINARLSLVEFFHSRQYFREDLVVMLPKLEDASRIVQKFSLGRGDASDLLGIKNTTAAWSSLRKRIERERLLELRERTNFKEEEWSSLDSLLSRMVNLDDLYARIDSALQKSESGGEADGSEEPGEEGSIAEASNADAFSRSWRYNVSKWTIKADFSDELARLHADLARLLREKEDLETKLQLQYDASSLTLRSSPGIGLHVHIAKSKRDRGQLDSDAEFVPVHSSNTTISYFYPKWSRLGAEIFETSMLLVAAEKEAFETLRREVNMHAPMLRRNARIIDELDVTLGFAILASEMNFVKPTMKDDISFTVVNGRHPTVELGLMTSGRMFTSNSLELGGPSRLQIITGPNMAGKSTLLRQTALVALLAQAGSFVPAQRAELGIVDKLFSRVGAKDDLFHDRSTFMVEMLETAEILRRATPRSLVIMDEVGRGTTVKDGLALAYASIHHLATINRSRTLFATHFNELADMLGYSEDGPPLQSPFDMVSFFCTRVEDIEGGRFAYSYRVRPGVNRDSHGMKVALLAGMPSTALSVAEKTLQVLNTKQEARWQASDFPHAYLA